MNVTVKRNGLAWADVGWGPGVGVATHYDLWLDGRYVQSVSSVQVTDQRSLLWPGRTYRYEVAAMDSTGHELERAVADPFLMPWPEPLAGDWPVLGLLIEHPDVVPMTEGPNSTQIPLTVEQFLANLSDPMVRSTPGLAPFVADCSFGLLRLKPLVRRVSLPKPSTAYPHTWAGQTALIEDASALLPDDFDRSTLRLLCVADGGYIWGAGGPILPGTTARTCGVWEPSALAHEVGHLFGYQHAGSLLAMPDDLLHWSGPNVYGDTYDPMGGWQAQAHYSAMNKVLAGWVPQAAVIETRDPGLYQLDAVDWASTGRPQVLVIPLDDAGNALVIERVTRVNTNGGFQPGFVARFRPAQSVIYTTTQLLTRRASVPLDPRNLWVPPFDRDHPFLDKVRDLAVYVVDEQTVRVASLASPPVPQSAPPTPTITSQPEQTTTDVVATLTFEDAQAGVLFLADLDGAGFRPCASPVTYTALGLGGHVFSVKAQDALGQQSDAAMVAWTIVALPPESPLAVRITRPVAGSHLKGGSIVPLGATVDNAAGGWVGQTWLVSAGAVQGGMWVTPKRRSGGSRQNVQTVAVKVVDGKGRTATASETVTIT